MNKNIEISIGDHKMSVDIVTKTAEEHNIDLNKRTDWIKPLDFQKYIVERAPAMIHDVKVEEYIYDIEHAYANLEVKPTETV
jgi:hypothetical protein